MNAEAEALLASICKHGDPAYRVRRGDVEAVELPAYPDYFRVPGLPSHRFGNGETAPVEILQGNHEAHFESFTLPVIADIAETLTPWATWYLCTGWTGRGDFGGMAWGKGEVAMVLTTAEPVHAVATAYHEAWHLVEELMDKSVLARLDAQLSTGPAWPTDLRKPEHGYWSKACERRARAFEHYCMFLHEGGTLVPVTWEQKLFEEVRSGVFGRAVMAARAPKPLPAPTAADVITTAGKRAASWLSTKIPLAIRPTSMA